MRTSLRQSVSATDGFFQFALLGLLTTGFLALAGSHTLDWPVIAISLGAIAVRGWLVSRPSAAPPAIPAYVLSAAALVCVVFYPVDYYLISRDFTAATVHGFCLVAAVKVLAASSNRDFIYVGAVSFVELLGAAFLSFQPSFIGWLALYIVFLLATLTSGEIRSSGLRQARAASLNGFRTGWRLGLLAVAAAAGIVAITAGFFLIVPRTARAAAQYLPPSYRLSGFSTTVDLGNFAAITKDTRPVMHVLSYKRRLPDGLKWRGAALSWFDGRRWREPSGPGISLIARQGAVEVADQLQRSRRDGIRLLYRVDLESSDNGTVFVAGTPEFINIAARRLIRTASDSFRVAPAGFGPLSYEVSAHLATPLATALEPFERARNLQLPPIDARIRKLAREWAGEGTPNSQARQIEDHLRREFTYAIDTAHAKAADPLAHFLFERRSGYCEYFASAMAVMLRTLGIPSRVATGFQSGYFNEVSGFHVIRASDAHAWVEAWIGERGWVTFDPTPSAAGNAESFWNRANMYLDAANSWWQQWVTGYDPVRQAGLAARIGNIVRGWRSDEELSIHGAPWRRLAAIGGLAAIAFGFWWMFPVLFRKTRFARFRRAVRRSGSQHHASLLYERLLESLDKRGFTRPHSVTPAEFVKTLPAHERVRMEQLTELYNQARFGDERQALASFTRLATPEER